MERGERRGLTPFRTRNGVLAMTVLTLLFAPWSKASAQDTDTRSYVERQGFRAYQPPANDASLFTPSTTAFQHPLSESAAVAPATHIEEGRRENAETPGEEVIVVTGHRDEDFGFTERPEFEGDFFQRNGITGVGNQDLEGLAFLTPEEKREGWNAVRVPMFGNREGDAGPFFEAEGGRGHGLRAGVRF